MRSRHEASGRAGRDDSSPDRRILELLLLLLDAPAPLSRDQIFAAIPAYRTRNPSAGARKFERDKKDLRELGVPLLDVDPETNAYTLDRRAYALPAIELDDEERAALLLAAEAVRGAEGLAYRELIEDALRKLSFERPADDASAPTPHLALALHTKRSARGQRKRLADLTRAAETHKRVRLIYASDDGKLTERSVDPYAVVCRAGDWLLVGYCHLRAAERTFRVDRVRSLRLAPRPATPDFVLPPDWSLARYLRRSPWVFQAGHSASVEVVLDVGPERQWVADEEFGEGVRCEPLADGWLRVRFVSGNPDYVVTRVLDGAGQLRLVAPESLRRQVLRVCDEALVRNGRARGTT